MEGYELHQFDEAASATARRVVDLRGAVAKLPPDDAESHHRATGARDRVFSFKVNQVNVPLTTRSGFAPVCVRFVLSDQRNPLFPVKPSQVK